MAEKKCFLRPLDGGHEPILLNDNTPLTLGRGPLTKIRDSRCSRTQVMFTAQYDKNIVKATQLGRNACGYNNGEISIDKSVFMKHGEVIEILSGQSQYMVDFDPPPGKTNLEKINSKRKVDDISDSDEEEVEPVKQAKMDSDSNKPGHWHTVQDELLIFKSSKVENRSKIAAFDLDHTIITTISKASFPKNDNDWKFLFKNTISKLEKLVSDGFKIVIFTNQGGILDSLSAKKFQNKIEKIALKCQVPFEVFVALGKGYNRKPCPGMWEAMIERNGGIEVNINESFFCGDAAGRVATGTIKADFSQADVLFARNLKLKFMTPEECFSSEKNNRAVRITAFDASALPNDIPLCDPENKQIISSRQEMVILVGSPGSGKTHFAETHLIPNGYVRVNRDQLGTMTRCLKQAEQLLNKSHKIVIDNTNGTKENRNKFITLATRFKVPLRAFVMKVTKEHAKHNNKFRQLTDKLHSVLSDIVIHKYYETYEEPSLAEGFIDIVKINFWPTFEKPEHEKLYNMFLLEK